MVKQLNRILWLFGLLVLCSGSAEAQLHIKVDDVSRTPMPVIIPDFNVKGIHSKSLRAHIVNYLDRTKLFHLIDNRALLKNVSQEGISEKQIDFDHYRKISARLLIKGKLTSSAGSFKGTIYAYDATTGRNMLVVPVANSWEKSRESALGFVDTLLEMLTGEGSVFRTKIAFVSNRPRTPSSKRGKSEIYSLHFDSLEVKKLTNFNTMALMPEWSSDASKLIFVGYPKRESGKKPELLAMDMRSGGVESIPLPKSTSSVISPYWDARNNAIVVTLNFERDMEIYRLRSSGRSIPQRITRQFGIDVSPGLSPDAKQMVYCSERGGGAQIYVRDLTNLARPSRRLTFDGDYNTAPAWSPRGNLIAFTGRTIDYKINVFVIRPDGAGGPRQLTFNNGRNEGPSWSPDGRYLVFTSDRSGQRRLYTMLWDGSQQRMLLGGAGSYSDKAPSWSPRLKKDKGVPTS